ncbi:MAG: GspE/PulE family protein [Phycisphaerales bacterium]|nr:GspE/PulE family protein [Phycisphaerales bacterium]
MNDVLNILVQDAVLDATAVAKVRDQVSQGVLLEDALRAAAPEDRVLKSLAAHFEVPFADLAAYNAPKEFLARFPARVLLKQHLLPLREEDGAVLVATSRLFDTAGLDELTLSTGLDLRPVLAPTAEIDRCIKTHLGIGADTLQSMASDDNGVKVVEEESDDMDLSAAAEDASIIRFVNQVLSEALDRRSTDVHFEPFENQLRVRYRVDGLLQEANIPPEVRRYHAAIISRIKILAHLDIAEKRLPQDGRIRVKVAGRDIDLRVSVIPMIHGEAVVLRILDRGDMTFGLEYLGMAHKDSLLFEKILDLPHGIVLVTGPTGSGKTTTLYAALTHINDVERKIITVEDPVEYQLRGINQIQVNTKTGLSFASGLRAILRHDPDVVLIGEIRDRETAEIAVQASLTGHLVFSTLHTNDAPGAMTRLVDMGVEPYLVSSSLEMVLAQRLVRLICKQCKEETPAADLAPLRAEYGNLVPEVVYRGRGCRNCMGTGYRGRTGIFEMMPVSEELRGMIIERASTGQLRTKATETGMHSLREDGWRLIREGRTTIEEVVRNTKEEQLVHATEDTK